MIAVLLLCCATAAPLRAQDVPHDSNLPSVTPGELQQLSDDRLRQRIMRESVAPYHGRCTCPLQVDAKGRSCRGRIHILASHPKPLCYPREVTDDMLAEWRRQHR